MKAPSARLRGVLALALVTPFLASCSLSNPFRSASPGGYSAPEQVGRGDCSIEVQNLSSRPLYAYYYLGIDNPPRLTSGWPRLGLLEPGQSTVVRGDCGKRRLTVHAYATAPVDISREYRDVRRDIAMVAGRRDVLRLRLTR